MSRARGRVSLPVLAMLATVAVMAFPAGVAKSASMAPASFTAFEGGADSYAVGSQNRVAAALPLPIESFFPRTRSSIDSQPKATGYAGVVDVPLGEVIAQFGAPSPLPNYCYAFFPGKPSAECGVQPLSPVALGEGVAGGLGVAHAAGDRAAPDLTSADSVATFSGYASDAFQFTVGSARSASFSRIAQGVLENGTETVMQNVDIGGGTLQFEQIKVTANAATTGLRGGAKAASSLTFNGVTVMGTPAPTPPELDLATLIRMLTPLASSLAAQGVVIHAVDPPTLTATKDGSKAVAEQRGLVIDMVDPKTGNGTTFTLSRARATAYAVPDAGAIAGAGAPSTSTGISTGTADGTTDSATGVGVDAFGAPPAPIPTGQVPSTDASADVATTFTQGGPLSARLVASPELFGQKAVDGVANVYTYGAIALLLLGGLGFWTCARRAHA